MTPSEAWPTGLTHAAGRQVRRFREGLMSADALAAAVTELGLPYTRAQVTNLEAGRRASITLGELLALALVLRVPPLALMVPVDGLDDVEILPGAPSAPWDAARWITGEGGNPSVHVDLRGGDLSSTAVTLRAYRRFDAALENWRRLSTHTSSDPGMRDRFRDGRLAPVRNAVDELHDRALRVPELPSAIVEELAVLDEGKGGDR